MKRIRATAAVTIVLFLLSTVAASYPVWSATAGTETDETARLVKEADEAYQNGNFKLAIEKYQKAMQLIGEKKELAQTKQELFQTMTSLALTYFTIQENDKAERQLADLVQVNPNQELDPEYYPPKFLEMFRSVQANILGKLTVTSTPAGAAVTLGANKMGTTPLTVERLAKGKYQLKVELPGYAPVSREILVQAAVENREELQLEALKPVVEKSQPPPAATAKKKKKLSPLLIVGGAVLVAAVAVLAFGKKSTQKTLTSLSFTQSQAMPINEILPTTMLLQVQGVPAGIERVDFRVVIAHQNHMEDLVVNIVGTDNQTFFNIWNRGQASGSPQIMAGSTTNFNAQTPNGVWHLLVQNPGHGTGGVIQEFTLRIYFYQ
jgi:subtilisin-like proprotein convertase family protein